MSRSQSLERRTDRPDRPWRVRWREEGRQRSRSFKRRADARHFEAELELRQALGAHAPGEPSRMTLDAFLVRWIEVLSISWAGSTREQRADLAGRHIAPRIGGVQLRDLGRARVQTWRRDLSATASPQTVNAATAVLSAALSAAVDEGLIPANPCHGLRPVPTPPVDRRAIPLEVVDALRGAMPTDRDRLIVSLLCFAGLRPGELRALRWADVGERSLHVAGAATAHGARKRTKTGLGRSVPIRPELAGDLARDGGGLVVPGRGGQPVDWHNWSGRVWRRAREAVGSDHVPYEGRHTYASLLIAEGASVVQVAAWMGHATPTTTLRHYAHLFDAAAHS